MTAFAVALATLPTLAHAQAPLASGLLRILGARLTVQVPANVPINTPFSLPTQLVDGDGHPLAAGTLFATGTVFVRGDLSGAGGLYGHAGGDACGTGTFIMTAASAVATIKALEQIFVTSVSSRPLSLEEIQDRGILSLRRCTADAMAALS